MASLDDKALLTLREAADALHEPIGTVRGWVYRYKVLPVEYVGRHRVRVRVSTLHRFYFGESGTLTACNSVVISSIR